MDLSSVVGHYGRRDPFERICSRLSASGHDLSSLEPGALAGVDEFHLGGHLATAAILDGLAIGPTSRVLDVGCGIGGVARSIAMRTGADVTGVDLTPEFVHTARSLTSLLGPPLGSSDRVRFEVGDALNLSCADDSFDVATLFHVGMNIADKAALFCELGRVLRPGGTLVVYDIMRTGDGDLEYPLPWSSADDTNHLASADDYRHSLQAAGLAVGDAIDRLDVVRRAIAASADSPPPVDLSDLMGEGWPTMFSNLRSALDSGLVRPIQIVATNR